jgi:hypothetical protein
MDDGFWVLLALFGVVFVLLGPIGFFLTIGARRRLQIAERKILALETQMRATQGMSAAAPATQTGEAPSAQPEQAEEIKPEGVLDAATANDHIGVAESLAAREAAAARPVRFVVRAAPALTRAPGDVDRAVGGPVHASAQGHHRDIEADPAGSGSG